MAKRFTDTEIWNDPWFRKLSLEGKVLWRFFVERCDAAGFWKKDYELASFQCGFEVSEEKIKELNNGKTRVADHGEHFQIVDFIKFQYGTLSADCKPHKSILNLLDSYQKKGYLKGTHTLQEQEKEKEQVKDKKEASSLDYLSDVPPEDLKDFTTRFTASSSQIKSKAEDLKNWCEMNGKRKKNYRLFLLNALKKDFPERPPGEKPPSRMTPKRDEHGEVVVENGSVVMIPV